jgi:hypothetical protein
MAIANLGELRSSVLAWLDLEVGQAGVTNAQINEAVALTEASLRRKLRTREGLASTTGTTVTAEGRTTVALPTGYRGVAGLDLQVDGDFQSCQDLGVSVRVEYDHLVLWPTFGSDYEYRLDYVAELTPLEDDTDSNWILDKYPDCYLFGVLATLTGFMKSHQEGPDFGSRFVGILDEIDEDTVASTWGLNQPQRDNGGGTP